MRYIVKTSDRYGSPQANRANLHPAGGRVERKRFDRCPRCGYTKDIYKCKYCWQEMCRQCWNDKGNVCPDCGRWNS